MSLVVTGMVPYNQIKVEAPLATAFQSVGQTTIATIISFGALAGLTTVILILLMGQSRVFFAMSRDHLLPPVFSRVSKRFGTPYRTTIVTGIVVAALAFFIELKTLAELVNIGTLFAFIVVAIGVIVLRRTRPDLDASLPHAVRARDPDPLGARLGVADAEPADVDVGAVRHLDGDRLRRVLRLLKPPQPRRQGRRRAPRRRPIQPPRASPRRHNQRLSEQNVGRAATPSRAFNAVSARSGKGALVGMAAPILVDGAEVRAAMPTSAPHRYTPSWKSNHSART